MTSWRYYLTLLASLGLVVLGSGASYVSASEASEVITACYSRERDSAELKLVHAHRSCGPLEESLSWNKAGVRGPPGERSEEGDTGQQGVRIEIVNGDSDHSVGEWAGLAWPVIVVGLLGLLFFTRPGRNLLSNVRRVKFGQLELGLGGQNAAEVKSTLEGVFRNNRSEVEREFNNQAHARRVAERRNAVARGILKAVASPNDFRCTVYVPDVLFDDALYCLLDYWPKGAAAGKAYSVRYGIIGRAWRLQESQAKTVVAGDGTPLMEQWGMTDQEAAGHIADRSFLAVLLTRSDSPDDAVGILFADAKPNTFNTGQINQIQSAPETRRLAEAVEGVVSEMRQRGPELRVFER